MKIEPRGKYAGVKVHLDEGECVTLIKFAEDGDKIKLHPDFKSYMTISLKIGRKIKDLIEENPNLLQDRTEEEIHATLSKEAIESALKLEAIGKKADWKKIHVEVEK